MLKELTITKLAKFISIYLTKSQIEEILLEAGETEPCRNCAEEPISLYREDNPQLSSRAKRLKHMFSYYSERVGRDENYYHCLVEIINAFYNKIHSFTTTNEGKEILKRLQEDGLGIEKLGVKKKFLKDLTCQKKLAL